MQDKILCLPKTCEPQRPGIVMRILVVGENRPWSSETGYARALCSAGCDVKVWDNKQPRLLFGRRNWWTMGRGSRATYNAIASAAFLREATSHRPDVIFMPKGENIHSRAVKIALQRTGAKLITWYPDHPFKADMTSMNMLRNLPRYDLFYIWGKFLVESIQAAGAERVEYLPFCFDPCAHPTEVGITPEDRRKYSCEVCFVGAWDREREKDLAPLSAFDLALWGPGWEENVSADSPLRAKIRGGGLYNEDLVKTYRCSSVVFNHLRQHNGSAHNMRAMEIAGIGGGVQLVRRTPELSEELFDEEKHLLCFGSREEMSEKVRNALRNSEQLKSMSSLAREHTIQHHLLAKRVSKILADLQRI